MNKKIFIDGGAREGESLDCYIKNRSDLKGCEIHFFECNPIHIPRLESLKITEPNYDIHIHEKALWNRNGYHRFYKSIDRWGDVGSTLLRDKLEKLDLENLVLVETAKLSDFLDRFDDSDYIIVKLDIEGAEYEVLTELLVSRKFSKIKELYVEWHDAFFDKKDFAGLRGKLFLCKDETTIIDI